MALFKFILLYYYSNMMESKDQAASAPTPSREEILESRLEHMKVTQSSNPTLDLKLESRWWVPATNLAFDVQVSCFLCFTPHL